MNLQRLTEDALLEAMSQIATEQMVAAEEMYLGTGDMRWRDVAQAFGDVVKEANSARSVEQVERMEVEAGLRGDLR